MDTERVDQSGFYLSYQNQCTTSIHNTTWVKQSRHSWEPIAVQITNTSTTPYTPLASIIEP
ncbi:hypothetical protein CU097_002362 [Rhizopus azygosporus]|uniref:Uncharacterized protein n=1 Tax=Rhizopus azygosporus TaxID=86630 RepID=A0A367JQJ0_RHIAZ|nr:hypothetical protein CU097_002362 [Rhizopus azygosporus]